MNLTIKDAVVIYQKKKKEEEDVTVECFNL